MASTSNASSSVSTRLSYLPRVTGQTDEEEIDPNVCCMCFVTFEEDTRELPYTTKQSSGKTFVVFMDFAQS